MSYPILLIYHNPYRETLMSLLMEVTFISLQIGRTLNQSNMSNTAHKNFDITFVQVLIPARHFSVRT